MSGYVAIHRSLFTSPGLKRGPFCEHAAWMWLIAEAAWKPTQKRIGSAVFNLERGQCAHALRFMAKAWMWDKNRVVRFLARLRDDSMITTLAGREATLITICKYEEYQSSRDADAPQNGTQTGRERDKLEEDNKLEESKNSIKRAPREPYVFEGEVIKLTAKHFDAWAKNHEHLELRSVLSARDAWISSQPLADRENWFISTANYLARKNAEARATKHQSRMDEICPPEIYRGLQ